MRYGILFFFLGLALVGPARAQEQAQLAATWQADHLVVTWSSAVPACLAVWRPGTGEHVIPETCQTTTWTLAPGGGDAAYLARQDTVLRLIANDGDPRVLAAQPAPLQPRRWLPVVVRP